MINICCCLQLKSKQIPELFQKRAFNGSTGVIGYADSKYDTVNNMSMFVVVLGVIRYTDSEYDIVNNMS